MQHMVLVAGNAMTQSNKRCRPLDQAHVYLPLSNTDQKYPLGQINNRGGLTPFLPLLVNKKKQKSQYVKIPKDSTTTRVRTEMTACRKPRGGFT